MRTSLASRVWIPALALAAAATICADHGQAETVRSGNLVMSLSGGIAPQRLPRDRAVPAAATLASGITTVDGSPLPRVRRIEVAFSGAATVSAAGLPVCPRVRLLHATGAEALERCGGSLVGRGRLPLELRLPGHLPLPRAPRVLVFNGRDPSRGTILWLHAFVAQPPVSLTLPFHVRRGAGSFPTLLVAPVPRSVASRIRIGGFEVTLHRRYRRQGRTHSYLSASCPVPPPFTAGFFPVVRATYSFADSQRLGNTIVRSCRVAS